LKPWWARRSSPRLRPPRAGRHGGRPLPVKADPRAGPVRSAGPRPAQGYDRGVVRALLFDFNGVLVDDEPIHLEMFQRVLAEEGLALSVEDYYERYLGLDDRGCFAAVLERAGELATVPRLMRLIARKASYYQERVHERGYPFFAGADE